MDTNTVAAAREGAPQAPRLGFLQRLVGIYLEPKKTFEDLERKRSWVGMFLIVAVLVMIGLAIHAVVGKPRRPVRLSVETSS